MKSYGGLAAKWMEKYLVHGIGDVYGTPYRLLPWHRDFLWRWFTWDDQYEYKLHGITKMGHWFYKEALIGAEAGAVKTEFVAALALLALAGPKPFQRVAPVITMAAASYDQAGQLFTQAQIMAGGTEDSPCEAAPLHGMFDVFDKQIRHRSGKPGVIQRVAARAATAEGGKESELLADELHEWHGAMARVYDVRAKSLSKRTPFGRVVGLSTAGVGRGSIPPAETDPLLWRLYARGLMQRGDPSSRYLFEWLEADAMVEQMRNDPEYLRRALAGMRAADVAWSVDERLSDILTNKIPWSEALRYYYNIFLAMHVDSWLNEIPGVWEECQDDDAAPEDGSEVVIGVDMALRFDSVGIVVAGIKPDGSVGWYDHHFPPINGRIDHLDVFRWILDVAADRWRVRGVCYDPLYFELPARLIEDEGMLAVEFPQSHERLIPADTLTYNLVVAHKLKHRGTPVMNAHAGNAAWRSTDRGRFWSKGRSGRHIDLLRAGSMATWELIAGYGRDDFAEFISLEG